MKSVIQHCKESDKPILENIYSRLSPYFSSNNLKRLRHSTINTDINESNILVKFNEEIKDYAVTGIIDYGDVDYDCLIFELGISAAYILLTIEHNMIQAAGKLIAGYHSVLPITEIEYKGLPTIIAARLFQSIVLANYQYSIYPDNEYIMSQYSKKWEVLNLLLSTPQDEIFTQWNKIIEPAIK